MGNNFVAFASSLSCASCQNLKPDRGRTETPVSREPLLLIYSLRFSQQFQSKDNSKRAGQRGEVCSENRELFTLTDELLNDRLDGLVFQFKDSQSAFHGEYSAARVIVDLPGGRANRETPAPAPVNAPLSKAA